MSADYDVAVVGFGPSGAVATALLGQAGFRTLTIDRAETIYDKPRAMAIDHEILRMFDGLGVAEAVLPHTAPFAASDHFGVNGKLIRRIDMVPPPFPMGFTPSMVFSQPPVEAILRAHAVGMEGVTVRLGCAATGIAQDADRATLLTTQSSVTADHVIACDGAASFLRQALGLPLTDLVFDEPWLVVDLLVEDAALPRLPQHAAQFCDPARPITYLVGPGRHRRFEIMILPGEDPAAMQADAWPLLARWLAPGDAVLWRAAAYRFHALVAERWREGRVFLAGDAAHQQPPFIGQGMCQGLRDVANLVWKLAAVRDGADPALLDTYGEERGAHVRTLSARIKAIGRQICERDPAAACARDASLLEQGGGRAPVVTRQEIVPGLETGFLDATPHPARGTLFPQPRVWVNGTWVLLDHVTGPGSRLILATGLAAPTAIPAWTIGDGGLLERDGIVAAWFARMGVRAAILRPDHYVYGVANCTAEIARMLADIDTVLMPRAKLAKSALRETRQCT